MSTKAKRIIGVLLCVAMVIALICIIYSCSGTTVYELGSYTITESEYAYLLSSYKRTVLDGLGLDEEYLTYPVESGSNTTYGEYIEKMYRQEFEQSVYSLLYSQLLFDEYGLSFTSAQEEAIKDAADTVIWYYADGSTAKFDQLAKDCGFDHDALYSIYEKRQKEQLVINHLLGKDYSKITDTQKNNHYKDNFIHFQIIVVNSLYQRNADGTFSNLSESERKTKLDLEKELNALLCQESTTVDYPILSAILKKPIIIENEKGEKVINVTYEELWANPSINDDLTYPGGYYMEKPNMYQLTVKNTLSTAWYTKEGDVSASVAKRYFEGNGTIILGDSQQAVKEGDYFEYGSTYIKRLPLEDEAWQDEANKDFFSTDFITGAAQSAVFKTYQNFEATSGYTLIVNNELVAEYTFMSVSANRIDYDYVNPSTDKKEENK